MQRLSFTMLNEGFRSHWVKPYAKALLVTVVLEDDGMIRDLAVFRLPLAAIKMLERDNVFHYERKDIPQRILDAIDAQAEQHMHEIMSKVATDMARPELRLVVSKSVH